MLAQRTATTGMLLFHGQLGATAAWQLQKASRRLMIDDPQAGGQLGGLLHALLHKRTPPAGELPSTILSKTLCRDINAVTILQ